MRLPGKVVIAPSKITQYLLVPQVRGDKSAFLAKAGYAASTASELLEDLRSQLACLEATPLERTEFGRYYEIRGHLKGPNGTRLAVRTIWMTESESGITKFITLIPDKGRRP
jgi:hypothetical protein